MADMARATNVENDFIKQATRIGLEKMLLDVEKLLEAELTEAQLIINNEMRKQIMKHLEVVS